MQVQVLRKFVTHILYFGLRLTEECISNECLHTYVMMLDVLIIFETVIVCTRNVVYNPGARSFGRSPNFCDDVDLYFEKLFYLLN